MEDEASVETVGDELMTEKEFLQQEQMESEARSPGWFTIVYFALLSNPWFGFIGLVVLYLAYNRYRERIQQVWSEWKESRYIASETAAIKKNPDLYRAKMEAMDRARRALQEKYDREAAEAMELARIRDEEKRQRNLEQLENLTQGKGYRNKIKVAEAEFSDGVRRTTEAKNKKKPIFRPEYNPLMGGGGGSSGYRPSRRSNNAGG